MQRISGITTNVTLKITKEKKYENLNFWDEKQHSSQFPEIPLKGEKANDKWYKEADEL